MKIHAGLCMTSKIIDHFLIKDLTLVFHFALIQIIVVEK